MRNFIKSALTFHQIIRAQYWRKSFLPTFKMAAKAKFDSLGSNDIEAPKALDTCLKLGSEANEILAAIFCGGKKLAVQRVSMGIHGHK